MLGTIPPRFPYLFTVTHGIISSFTFLSDMRCCRSDWALFVLLFSTFVCFQPTELIWGFFCFINFPFYSPPPLTQGRPYIEAEHVRRAILEGLLINAPAVFATQFAAILSPLSFAFFSAVSMEDEEWGGGVASKYLKYGAR